MKILHMLDSLNRGGAETLALDVCRNARANGMDLTFVASGGGDLEEDFRQSGADFIRLRRRLPLDAVLVWRLRRIIQERDIRVAHSQQPVEALHLYIATRGLTTKCVLTLHGLYPGNKNELSLRFVLPRMDARIVPTDDMRSFLAREQGIEPGGDYVTVNNGVDFQRIRAKPGGGGLRSELGLDPRATLLGMVANFYPGQPKDHLTVCQALPALFERVPAAHFVFAGARSEAAPAVFDDCVNFCRERGISRRVHFLGKRSDIPAVLGSLDVFVLSSMREGFGMAAIEAMGMGIPPVLSDIGALREISGGGRYAVLFRTGDPQDLAEKLAALLRNPDERARLGAQAKQWAVEQFGIEQHIRNLIRVYQRLTGDACAS
jgi:glycosyltransferase involved in cell wall biosynthesis